MDEIRLDKYLWAVRIFKTRSDAADAVRNNKVTVNGSYAKPSREVKLGDVIAVRKQQVTYSYKVLDLVSSRQPAKNVPLYCLDITPQEELAKLNVPRETIFVFRDRGTGRPTKKERRELDSLMDGICYDDRPCRSLHIGLPRARTALCGPARDFFLCAAGAYSRSRRAGGVCRSGSRRPGCGSGLRRCRRGLRPARGPAGGRQRPGRYPQRPHICSETLRFAHSSA